MRNIGDISMLIADASEVKGTGVSMKIKEIVKGSGNTIYLLRIPVHARCSFQIRYLEEHTDLYHTDIDVGIVNAELMLNIYILPLSSSILDDHVLRVEVYTPCNSNSIELCF